MSATASPESLGHLHESVRAAALLPASERLCRLGSDRWIGYTRANQALERLEALFSWPQRERMPNLLVIGPTNDGKSMVIEKFRRLHPTVSLPDREQIPVLVVQMPSEPSVSRFYVAVQAAMGAPIRPRQRIAELEQSTLSLLRAVGVKVLVIDEPHNVLAGRGDARREFLNLIRFLGNELRIPLVGVGTKDAYLAIRADDHSRTGSSRFPCPGGNPGRRHAHCWRASARPSRSGAPRRSGPRRWPPTCEGTIGELSQLLTAAAAVAIESGEESINQRTLLEAAYTGPSERRRMFERTLA